MSTFVNASDLFTVHVFAKGQVYHYPASAVPELCPHQETKRLRNADGKTYGIGCHHCGKELEVLCPELKG